MFRSIEVGTIRFNDTNCCFEAVVGLRELASVTRNSGESRVCLPKHVRFFRGGCDRSFVEGACLVELAAAIGDVGRLQFQLD